MSKPSETRIMTWILAQLRERYPDGIWERQNVIVARTETRMVRAGTPGQADIRGLHRGVYYEFEIKRPGAKQTEEQLDRQVNVVLAGGVYAVVHNPSEAFTIVEQHS